LAAIADADLRLRVMGFSDRERGKGPIYGFCVVFGALFAVVVAIAAKHFHTSMVPVDPIIWTPLPLPTFEGPTAPNNKLAATKKLYVGELPGPEAFAIDKQGRLYTGLADGRVVRSMSRFDPDGTVPFETLVSMGSHPHTVCTNISIEPECGRPLGLAFDLQGNLLVCDSYAGLVRLNLSPSGDYLSKEVLISEVEGLPLRFANAIVVSPTGRVFFTDSSTKYHRRHWIYDAMESRALGRLIEADLETRTAKVLARGLHFANGLTLSPDGTYLLISETTRSRIMKYSLSGPTAGSLTVFVENLPGIPDEVLSAVQLLAP